ncbi:MAG: ammonium transporter, partial [Planctomycetaceae bacterium]|nr:ammonium transporter [Planctomycetaceae bacterium]
MSLLRGRVWYRCFAPAVLLLAMSTPLAGADDVLTWDAMSVEQKLDVLRESAVQVGDEGEVANSSLFSDMDTLWTCLAAFLVFFMQAGFALVETGFTRAKNACNIIMKNLMDFSIGSIAFWLVGFGLMFGVSTGFVGTSGFLFNPDDPDALVGGGFGWSFLLFQTVFAATAATIVSGAMAERTKFVSYLAYSIAITVIVYPVFGGWCWNGLVGATTVNEAGETIGGAGWLESRGFLDFAGSTVVHSIGGWCALAGAIVIGARRGKYRAGKSMPIPGHSIPLAALGVFILWLGWYGFNPGSQLTYNGASNAEVTTYIAVTTTLSAAVACFVAMVLSWIVFKKPDLSMALNGALAGLVGITANCDQVTLMGALIIGAVSGGLVFGGIVLLDKLKIDDPVGAFPVHGMCGVWGGIATGIFGTAMPEVDGVELTRMAYIIMQTKCTLIICAWAFTTMFGLFFLLKQVGMLRVPAHEEIEGLDIVEHGMPAYSNATPSPSATLK